MTTVSWLDPYNYTFPPVEDALQEPNGLVAVGGDLSPERLLEAYRRGIFPWYEQPQPILWWSPSPRTVLFPERVHISRSLAKALRQKAFTVTYDQAFDAVVAHCATVPREDQDGTWIGSEMMEAYSVLHRLGHAHSVEVWSGEELAGGLYGVAIGRVFFGESMFSRQTNASKFALVSLARRLQNWGFPLIDCQVSNPHLFSMGAEEISREEFLSVVTEACKLPGPECWGDGR